MSRQAIKALGVGSRRNRLTTPCSDALKAGVGLTRTPADVHRTAECIPQTLVDAGVSWSCYDPTPHLKHCGLCDSCRLRAKGFAEAGIPDPTDYSTLAAYPF
jgi:7-cyano-7-deazaguanine synthase in queuosine biosynthesis